MLKKILWALAPIVVSKLMNKQQQKGRGNTRYYPKGRNRRYGR